MSRRYGTGTVFERTRDHRWIGQAEIGRDAQGRRQRITVTADTEAAAWKALAAARSSSTSRRRRAAAGETVEAFLLRWLRDVIRPTKRERTYWGYRSIVDNALVPQFGTVDAARLSGRDVQRWVAGLTVSPMTVRHYIDVGRGAYRWGIKHGLRSDNPFRDLDLPRVERRDVKALSPAAARKLLAAVEDEWFAPLVTVALYTGLRQGELLGLRWEDVNLGEPSRTSRLGQEQASSLRGMSVTHSGLVAPNERGGAMAAPASLTVTRSLTRLPGPEGTRYVLTEPKSATSRRTVPLAAPAAEALRKVRREQLTTLSNPWGLVFARDGLPIDGTKLTHEFQAALKAAGLPVIRWHDLRHGFVSLMLAAGVPLVEVSKLAGHSGVGITADTYGHLSAESRREAVDKLAEVVG